MEIDFYYKIRKAFSLEKKMYSGPQLLQKGDAWFRLYELGAKENLPGTAHLDCFMFFLEFYLKALLCVTNFNFCCESELIRLKHNFEKMNNEVMKSDVDPNLKYLIQDLLQKLKLIKSNNEINLISHRYKSIGEGYEYDADLFKAKDEDVKIFQKSIKNFVVKSKPN